MTRATAAATSQDALDALVCGSMPPQGCWSDEQCFWLTDGFAVDVTALFDDAKE